MINDCRNLIRTLMFCSSSLLRLVTINWKCKSFTRVLENWEPTKHIHLTVVFGKINRHILLNLDQTIFGLKWLNLHLSWKQGDFFLDSGLQKGECIFSDLLMIYKTWNSFIKRRCPIKAGAGRYISRDPGGHSWAYEQDSKEGEMVITCFLYR